MLGPAARHLNSPDSPARVCRVLDRGHPGAERETRRQLWREHGAALVPGYGELLDDEVDGVLICAGKNGEDREILREVVPRLAALGPGPGGAPRFILHLSTLSSRFASTAVAYAGSAGLAYGNYPLTGGPAGAEAATMLILAGGDEALFQRVRPFLEKLGRPRYFGPDPTSGTETKLIGHYLVFHGLLGVCSGAALQCETLPALDPVEYFDFLNQGAGHTRQWEISLRRGLADGHWETGFYCRHAAIDALYAIQLGLDRGLNMVGLLPMYQVAILFALAARRAEEAGGELGTQAIFRHLYGELGEIALLTLENVLDLRDPEGTLLRVQDLLPESIRPKALLEVPAM
jgi:3-hydroxyisobutyrate dehydrogenase-like beta-hydroxyacid dehydrogenase